MVKYEEVQRYLDEIVEPTIKDFEANPTSERHAFLACVATFHAVDYIGRAERKSPATLRQQFRPECAEFGVVDDVAHAFKHVSVGKPSAPRLKVSEVIARPPAVWGVAVYDLSRYDDAVGGVTLDKMREIDLLDAVRVTAQFFRSKI